MSIISLADASVCNCHEAPSVPWHLVASELPKPDGLLASVVTHATALSVRLRYQMIVSPQRVMANNNFQRFVPKCFEPHVIRGAHRAWLKAELEYVRGRIEDVPTSSFC